MQQPKACTTACTLEKKPTETISNFQARARGGLRDRKVKDESNGTMEKKRRKAEVEEIVISHASDIVISTNSSNSLQVKEHKEPAKAVKIPVRKSTLSSGEVPNTLLFHHAPISSISTRSPLIFISSTKILCDPFPFSPDEPWPPIQLLFWFNPQTQVTVICSSAYCPPDPDQELRRRHKTVPIF